MWSWISQNCKQIESILTLLSVMISAVVLVLTYLNLKNLKDNQVEESRAHIALIIGKYVTNSVYSVDIKNYGKSSGLVEKIITDPVYEENKNKQMKGLATLLSQKNIPLAPGQKIRSIADFSCFENKPFDIKLLYTTCGKEYTEIQHIDLSYKQAIGAASTRIDDSEGAMKVIAHSIEELSDKLD